VLFLLIVPRVVRRVQVSDGHGANSAQLDDRLACGPSKVLHSGWHTKKGPGRHGLTGALVEFLAHAHVKRPRNHSEVLRYGMCMRYNLVWSFRKFDTQGKEDFLPGITLQHRDFRPRRNVVRNLPNALPG
jgi:hypothetical protein